MGRTMQYYEPDEPEVSWGDYGHILLTGMVTERDPATGMRGVMRTGPFVPPISFPFMWNIVVSDDLKRRLEESGLSGLSFRPIRKSHIVELDWHTWDASADMPK